MKTDRLYNFAPEYIRDIEYYKGEGYFASVVSPEIEITLFLGKSFYPARDFLMKLPKNNPDDFITPYLKEVKA